MTRRVDGVVHFITTHPYLLPLWGHGGGIIFPQDTEVRLGFTCSSTKMDMGWKWLVWYLVEA